ncbi:endonuclease/exonuclease/phosphatase family protein [Nocardioides sp.]|uniref:endonuclease/exonuclease/phosphatase family protein n=1 Tax=Nocardioides sp. TaxID=35761 RepID=UPI0027324EF0|nr:endonuclease/exonuclease/phosphatase family protein [Nocardioides sp.]MDP3892543.1 endonuclease/exonuclease/phosphatase family protein [Nocardioides sp.]
MRVRLLLLRLLLLALLVPAVLLTGVRLAEPDGGTWIRVVSFTPLAMPAYTLILVLLLLRAARPGERGRRPWVAAAALVLVPLGLHGWWFAPQVSGGGPAAGPGTAAVTVMSANLARGAGDGTAVLEAAVARDVDVLVLQEITPGGLREMEAAGLTSAFPFRAGEAGPGTAGTMILATGAVTDVEEIPTGFGGWVGTVDLETVVVRVLGVHPRPPVGDAVAWREDHGLVLEATRSAVSGDLPVVLAGDLNATPDHAPLRALADAGVRSAAELGNSGWVATWPAEGHGRLIPSFLPPLVQIDHVLVGDGWAADGVETVPVPGSDHRAVLARLWPGPR